MINIFKKIINLLFNKKHDDEDLDDFYDVFIKKYPKEN